MKKGGDASIHSPAQTIENEQYIPILSAHLRQPAVDLVRYLDAANQIYIATHSDPDGDAIGSLLGLTWVLREIGKTVTPACPDPVPEIFQFLPGSAEITDRPPATEDLIFVVDAGGVDRIGKLYVPETMSRQPTINIDHHITNTLFGDVVFLDTHAAATAEILYLLLDWLEFPITQRAATCLLTGVMTDTRSFRTSNTTPRVLRVAAMLMQLGAPMPEIARQVYESKPLASLCVLGRTLQRMQKNDGIIWSEVTVDMLQTCGARPEDASDVINVLNSTREADIAILFRENSDGGIDVSFRSKPTVDVSKIAVALGGGGHPQAAGCRLYGPLPEIQERVLALTRSMRDGDPER